MSDALVSEALRVYRRYQHEVVEGFRLCPWAEKARLDGRVREVVRLDRAPDVAPTLVDVDALMDDAQVDIGLASGNALSPVLFKGLSFGGASTEDGLSATASSLPIGIAAAGSTSGLVARFTVPAVDQQRAFVVAAGSLAHVNGRGLRFLVVDTAQSPWTVSTILPH